ncbi:hypothetical protein GE061_006764 [Apolygus lucorum]|uniref:Uncharacterized protein n=1 Tax=Apolygus lucorum TaxID=248454 RepID=A0A8S9WPS4_APOLU|nr:hypothetical protein GE061_006764 [Apolygus lucorum]
MTIHMWVGQEEVQRPAKDIEPFRKVSQGVSDKILSSTSKFKVLAPLKGGLRVAVQFNSQLQNSNTTMYKFLVLVAAVASAQAGLLASPGLVAAPAAVTSQSQNILRSWGNLGQVSTYSKTIDTPWSSVSKSDIRVSNPGLTSQTLIGSPLLAQRTIAAPALVGSPLLAQRTIAAPALVGSPLLAQRAIAAPALIGTAYSAAPAVSHMTYVNSLGLQYGW